MEQNIEKLQAIVSPLLTWYDENRRILPWREEVSAYRTWVSEIMLQQTRVAAVLPYFQRFMARYPTVQDLARGDEEELLKLWEGLGYYSRARNLQKAARIVAEDYAGVFPADYKELIALPGIGDYTAGAILSIAFGLPVPAVDGNVLRIASRITGWDRDVQSTKKEITRWMTEVVPSDRSGAFNQALMDLGSALCLPAAPRCPDCPLRGLCTAEREGSQARIPVRAPKKDKRPEEKTVFLLRRPDGAVALVSAPRPASWRGFGSTPMFRVCSRKPRLPGSWPPGTLRPCIGRSPGRPSTYLPMSAGRCRAMPSWFPARGTCRGIRSSSAGKRPSPLPLKKPIASCKNGKENKVNGTALLQIRSHGLQQIRQRPHGPV